MNALINAICDTCSLIKKVKFSIITSPKIRNLEGGIFYEAWGFAPVDRAYPYERIPKSVKRASRATHSPLGQDVRDPHCFSLEPQSEKCQKER